MSDDRQPLLPGNWSELASLLDQLLDAPVAERPALLAALAGDTPARRAALERLLAESEQDLPLMERPAVDVFPELHHEVGPLLPEVLGGRYRIEREVGRGGMARVYLAHDVKHARRVAVKVIRPEIASSLARERFLREIGIAARLRHPNIMPLYDSGDVDDLLYFVMPYEEGKSLRARLDREPKLGVAEAVSILRDVARALACAHEQGVVHRDIKPDNVLLSGDAAVVTDFGISKALTVAATEAGTESGTQAGVVIGTPAYMSPEQAIGDPATDHRADLYAFGCLAYEVFAGAPAFAGTTSHQIISAQLSERPKPLAEHRPDMPEAVARLIARCLEKNPADRPANATELLDVLGAPTATREQVVERHRRSRRLAPVTLALVVLLLGGWYAARANAGGPVTIAVLPLEVTGDSQSFARGFTEDLANALIGVPWLRVKSRGGASNYSGRTDIAPRTVGDSLGARYLLMGSFRRNAGTFSVMLRLIRSEDGAFVWGEKFVESIHLEALRDRIVRTIGDSLRRDAGRFANRFRVDTTPQQYAISDDAYTLYLQGKKKLAERWDVAGSIDLFRRAIDLDSTSAKAWSGLSLALAISVISQNASVDSIRPEATASADRATRLDSNLAESHVAMGVVHALDWQWEDAEREFKKAVKLDPNEMESRIQYVRVLFAQGRMADAHRQLDEALDADPASSQALNFRGQEYLLRGMLDSARTWNDRAMKVNSSKPGLHLIFRAMLFIRLNRKAEARQLVQDSPRFEPYSLYVLAATGDSTGVRRRLAELDAGGNRSAAAWTEHAYALLGLGDTTRALAALERATERRELWVNISPTALPVFDTVRESPRFQSLRKRAGLAAQ